MASLHVMAANGFPLKVYEPLFNHLKKIAPHRKIDGCDVAHMAVNCSDWKDMVNYVNNYIETSGSPVVGIGHSFGGALLATCSFARPDLYKALVIVDSPLFSPWKRLPQAIARRFSEELFTKYHPLISGALRKKNYWQTLEEVEDYVRSRQLYKKFDEDVIQAMLRESYRPSSSGGFELTIPGEAEANIYRTVPLEIPLISKSILGSYDTKTPGWFLYSDEHPFLSEWDIWWLKRNYTHLKFIAYRGSHFWPLEQPKEFGEFVLELLEKENI